MPFDLSNPDRRVQAGVILLNSATELLDVAPIDFLNSMSNDFLGEMPMPDHIKGLGMDIDFHWVNETGKPAKLTAGLNVECTDSFDTCPPLDVVVMGYATHGYLPNDAEKAFIRKSYDDCSAFIAICGGFEAPRRAGVLEGKTATAPRGVLDTLRQENPETNWIEKRYANDGKVWTTGTLLNGLDAMSAFARHTWPNKAPLVETLLAMGHYPSRDVDYKDADASFGKL